MAAATLYGIFRALFILPLKSDKIAYSNFAISNWSNSLLNACDAKLHVSGRENLETNKAYLFMSNHESMMDIPVVFAGLPHPIRGISKESLMKIPLFGHAMKAAGYVPIDRKNREKAIKQLEYAKEKIAEGISIWISPEGTRSRSGKFGEFKKGGFHLAVDLEVEIVPVWIDGAYEVVVPDTLAFNIGKDIQLHIGKPLPTKGLTKENLPELMKQVREAMLGLAHLAQDKPSNN